MAVSDYVASASLLSDGSGSFTAPPYHTVQFSTATVQFTHNGGEIERSGAGWGSCAWGTQFGPNAIVGVKIGTLGEFELELRGKDMGGSGWDAYGLYYDNAGGWEMYRTIDATATTLDTGSVTLAAGDVLWWLALGSGATVDLAAAVESGGSVGADFATYADTNAARLVNSGYIGIWANGTTFGADELYGGDAVYTPPGGDPDPTRFPRTRTVML